MILKLRSSKISDIDKIYELQLKCFSPNDAWYKTIIYEYINTGLVIEYDNNIIGVLLEGEITPCDKINNLLNNNEFKNDIYEPITEYGLRFYTDNLHYKQNYGIVMICIDDKYRGKKLAQKLILTHLNNNKNKQLCLLTRKTNISAYNLYLKMGYEHIANIKNKYYLPDEDAKFMILNN
jgi:ribosomal protein S18 acetylase RimI-like enzyme